MKFSITILGCQAALPTTNKAATSQLVNHSDRYFLIDCAEGTQRQLRLRKLKFQRINHIFISHLHGDHFLGILGLLSSLQLLGRQNKLTIYAPEGLEEFYKTYKRISNLHLKYEIEFVIISNKSEKTVLYDDDKLTIFSFPLDHRIDCWGFHFEEKQKQRKVNPDAFQRYFIPKIYGKKLKNGEDFVHPETNKVILNKELTFDPDPSYSYTYMSDTRYIENIQNLIEKTDVLYHEATFLAALENMAVKTYHSTATQAAEVAKKLNASKLILGHFSARYPNTKVLKEEAETIFEPTICGYDGLEILIP